MKINTIRVVGTTFECRQNRIKGLEEGAAVSFKEEKGNPYDPLAIAVLNEKGEHLGYIGKNDPDRERVRSAMQSGWVIARAQKVGGFKKWDGSVASLGLRVQWYAVDALYGFASYMGKDEPEEVVALKRENTAQKRKEFSLAAKYKGKELRKLYTGAKNIERVDPVKWRSLSKKRRSEFKRGIDIKPTQLEWHYGLYISEEEAKERFMERRAG